MMRWATFCGAVSTLVCASRDTCDSSTFPVPHDNTVFSGLHRARNVTSAAECQQACCEEIYVGLDCAVWQWADHGPALPVGTCWLGPSGLPSKAQEGWVSRGVQTPAPAPSPSSITCSVGHTPCSADYAVSHEGCCPFSDAVCCSDRQTCCPAGTTCHSAGPSLTTCVNSSVSLPAKSVCKPGPQHALSLTKKNVIVLGDSVSIGYTPALATALDDVAVVQHSPYDIMDGGAEETAYGLQCIDYFVHGTDGSLLVPDVLVFNFGLHDGPLGNATIPGQQGNSSVYAKELEAIVLKLKSIFAGQKTELIFALTTPVMCDQNADGNVVGLNNMAADIMGRNNVMMIDPHSAIIDECGPVPNATCFGKDGCFCPHCPGPGYNFLAREVFEPSLRKIFGTEQIIF